MTRFRLAILGASPCHLCRANCCKQNGHDYAVLLQPHEYPRFTPFSALIPIISNGQRLYERVLPYVNGRCQFLNPDDRCTIYQDRPLSCRQFECIRDSTLTAPQSTAASSTSTPTCSNSSNNSDTCGAPRYNEFPPP